jgi:hypothetical protein
MTTVELYYPETTAAKQISDVDGRIFFDLSFNNDLSGNKPISKNFATSSSDNDQFIAQNLFINSAENLPSLSDPNYPDNYATHYLVIFQKNASTNNCIAIPICNNYNGPWSTYAKDLKKTQVRSIDKLIQNQTSTIIDLNSTINELKGIGRSYKRYDDIEINYQNNDKKTMKTTLYVIDKFIYVEPVVKPSLYKQLITTSYRNAQPNSTDKYKMVSVSASCGTPRSSSPSSLFNIGKKPDAMSKFIYMNVLIVVVYLIVLLLFYNSYETIPPWGLLVLCFPLLAYSFMYTPGKKYKIRKLKLKKEKMENIESFKSKNRKSKKRKSKSEKRPKSKPIKFKFIFNYSEFFKYTLIGSYYSIAIVSLILSFEIYKKMKSSNTNFVNLLFRYGEEGVYAVGNWMTSLIAFFSNSGWSLSDDKFIYDILKPLLNAGAVILLIFLLFLGVNELIVKKIIKY